MTESSSAFVVQFDQAEQIHTDIAPGVLARMTHEMAESLGAIESIAYYLRMVLPQEDERTQQQLGRIGELVASMNGTLSDALQYFQQVPLEPQILDLHALLAEAVSESISEALPIFHLHITDQPALIRVDANQGRHLLRSLFSLFRGLANRCEEVHVRTSTEASVVALEFIAVGLDATRAEVEAMFEPFGRGFPEGTGLALASARRIFESNGGRISAASDDGRDLSLRGAFPRVAC
jgi:signal transduction histidine kinase